MANVIFKRGSGALPATPVDGTLYFQTDTGIISMGVGNKYVDFVDVIKLAGTGTPAAGDIQDSKLYIGDGKMFFKNGNDVVTLGDTKAIEDLQDAIDTLKGDDTTTGSIAKAIKDASDALKGTAATAKAEDETIAGAKKYAEELITGDPTADPDDPTVGLKIVKETTPETGFAATYKLMKDNVQLGASINLIKDQFLDTVELTNTDAAGTAGKYIHMTFKDTSKSEIYLNVNDLIDVYTSGSVGTDAVVIAVDATTNKITATITDGTVTKAKLASDVQDSLDLADSAMQQDDNDALYAKIYGEAKDDIPTTDPLTLKSINDKLTSGGAEWGDFTEVPATLPVTP